MSDNIVLSSASRPAQSWFSNSLQQQLPISQALEALEQAAGTFQAAAIQPEQAGARTVGPAQPVATPAPVELHNVEELDYELAVGSILDDISSVLEDVRDKRLAVNDKLVDLIVMSFKDIAKHIDHIPESLAAEVGELGAEVCDVIEASGTSAEPIISLFNP